MLATLAACAAISLGAPSAGLADALVEQASRAGLSTHPHWLRLLHYDDAGAESRIDGREFFLAETGHHDPQAELEATLRAFVAAESPPGHDMHAQCRYPARLAFVDEQLGFKTLDVIRPSCPELSKFMGTIQPGRVFLVFATAFLNAPASAFGHTLLRIENHNHPGSALLSTMVNYAAYPTTYNPFAYTVLGLIGGFPGRFAALPYYVKVQEYSNIEARDLWEYELTLTPPEVQRMLFHVWELDTTYFDYYFFTENCSYLLLRLLEIARPSLDLASQFQSYAIPSDTLKAIVDAPKLIRERSFRPAHTAVMNARRASLSDAEVALAEDLLGDSPPWGELSPLAPERQARVLEAAIDLHKYRLGFHPNQDADYLQTDAGQREFELLRARGKLELRLDDDIHPTPPRAPEGSHGSARVGLGVGINRADRVFQTLSWRAALHDVLDDQTGYVRDSTVELGSVRLRLEPSRFELESNRRSAIVLDRLDLVRIHSILPWDGWVKKLSWRVNFGVGWPVDLGCSRWRCTAVDLRVGTGLSFRSRWLGIQTFYFLADFNSFGGTVFENGYRLGVDGAVGTAWSLTEGVRLHAEAAYHYDFLGDRRLGADYLALQGGVGFALSRSFNLRVLGRSIRDTREVSTQLIAYY